MVAEVELSRAPTPCHRWRRSINHAICSSPRALKERARAGSESVATAPHVTPTPHPSCFRRLASFVVRAMKTTMPLPPPLPPPPPSILYSESCKKQVHKKKKKREEKRSQAIIYFPLSLSRRLSPLIESNAPHSA